MVGATIQPALLRDDTDRGTWDDVRAGYHRPPPNIHPRTILDLGCHAGLTLIDFADRFPPAHIWGVEMDFSNFNTARINAGWMPNVKVIHSGIATWVGYCDYEGGASNAYRITGMGPNHRAPVTTIDALMASEGIAAVDFMKVDIEGMEAQVFKQTAMWPYVVQCVKAELHGDYSVDEAQFDLRKLGYTKIEIDSAHPACIVARRW